MICKKVCTPFKIKSLLKSVKSVKVGQFFFNTLALYRLQDFSVNDFVEGDANIKIDQMSPQTDAYLSMTNKSWTLIAYP